MCKVISKVMIEIKKLGLTPIVIWTNAWPIDVIGSLCQGQKYWSWCFCVEVGKNLNNCKRSVETVELCLIQLLCCGYVVNSADRCYNTVCVMNVRLWTRSGCVKDLLAPRNVCMCQGTPAAVPTRANIRVSTLNKGSSGDPGTRSAVSHTARGQAVSAIYTRNHSRYYLLIVTLLA
jgi:hypothetical protein